ncbi:MAG: Uncharacterized protein Athens101410_57 [Parcubacteria group bacterium Athens1014_10]|nr:MAG: Uncharacterized protein Athens101410_57 [Parcubacteria group bacterium Athens1014_10]TSD06083.1 MAG: Uncharacterized protein Athens071412_57 [Parcubacteria group bacterium Athens0714_12]
MNISKTQLKINYWLIANKQRLKMAWVLFLIILSVFLWGINIYKWFRYAQETVKFQQSMEEIGQNFIDWQAIHSKNDFLPLEISDISFIPLGNSRYDLVAQINNPNNKWAVSRLDYRFFWEGREAGQSTFILAQEKKFLLVLNIKSDIEPKGLNLEFLEVGWKRITAKNKIPDFKSSDFAVKDISSNPSLKRISFQVKNNSAYNFWTVYFKSILYQGDKVSAVNKIPANKFLSGQERLIEIPFQGDFPYFTRAIIEPEVNILDENNFMPIKAE